MLLTRPLLMPDMDADLAGLPRWESAFVGDGSDTFAALELQRERKPLAGAGAGDCADAAGAAAVPNSELINVLLDAGLSSTLVGDTELAELEGAACLVS